MQRRLPISVLALTGSLVASASASAQDLLHTFQGVNAGDRFGRALANVGDVDGDGVVDLAIGAPGSDVTGVDAGEVQVRSGLDGSLLLVLYGTNPGDNFGGSLAGTGDVDGDGVPDLLVGATTDNKFPEPYGGEYVRLHSGADGSVIHQLTTPSAVTRRFGFSVAGAGDLDGDGKRDFIVGAPDFEPD